MQRVLIAGTGTGVGKTYATARLREGLSAHGHVVALKPIESGYTPQHSDARTIGGPDWRPPLYALREPVSPHLAARLEGQDIDLTRIPAWVAEHAVGASIVLVETAGGLFSPLTDEGHTNADVLCSLTPCKWVLVAANRLGVLHDVTAALLASKGSLPPPSAILLSSVDPDASSDTNARELSRMHETIPVFTLESSVAPGLVEVLISGR